MQCPSGNRPWHRAWVCPSPPQTHMPFLYRGCRTPTSLGRCTWQARGSISGSAWCKQPHRPNANGWLLTDKLSPPARTRSLCGERPKPSCLWLPRLSYAATLDRNNPRGRQTRPRKRASRWMAVSPHALDKQHAATTYMMNSCSGNTTGGKSGFTAASPRPMVPRASKSISGQRRK